MSNKGRKFEEIFDDGAELKASRKKRVGGYVLGSLLGEGSFAKVRLGSHIMTRERVRMLLYRSILVTIRLTYLTPNLHRR